VTVPGPQDRLRAGKLPAALLSRLLAAYPTTDPTVLVGPGIGRDATAIAFGDRVLVAKTDPITFASAGAAAYLIDVNANDLACMGARARYLLVTALFPEGVSVADVERQFHELGDACGRRGISLVGGHTEVTQGVVRPILVGMMLGDAMPDRLVAPGGARPGDRILVGGAIAVEGTALLAREIPDRLVPLVGREMVGRAARLLESPGISVLPAIDALAGVHGVRALHDPTEGGLSTGIRELASASGCGAEIDRERVPVRPETVAVSEALGLDPLGMLASGSLLLAADPGAVDAIVASGHRGGVDFADIGRLTDVSGEFRLRDGGTTAELPEWTTDEVSRALESARAGHDHAHAVQAGAPQRRKD